ncbi:glycosyltransferase [Phocaeicola coprophilus]|uniref:glycosyltransferase n=1 Tax=Phocaeicola coprophilus TaxID=387090 RepID=UPI003076E1A5
MKILHVVWVLRFGGIETMLMNIANEQVTMGHEVSILLIDKDSADPELTKRLNNHVTIYSANRIWGIIDLPAFWRMNRLIKKINPDVIHLHSAAMYKYLSPSLRKFCNVTLHALCNTPNTDHIEKIARVFSISQSVADDLMQKKHVKSIVNPNGIKPELIKTSKKLNIQHPFRIVQVSRLDHLKKGQHLLIQSCKILLDRGFNNFTIDFIGNGPSLNFLKNLVKENHMENIVRFLGEKDQQYIYDHLCEYDLFVQPSIYEGFGLTVTEAMAAKIPVIVSSGQGPEEVIEYGKCGTVFCNNDIIDCANKIELYMNGQEEKSLVEKAYEKVWNTYNIKTTVETYLTNYIRRK